MDGVDVCVAYTSQVMTINSRNLGPQFPTRLPQFSNSRQHRLDDGNHGLSGKENQTVFVRAFEMVTTAQTDPGDCPGYLPCSLALVSGHCFHGNLLNVLALAASPGS